MVTNTFDFGYKVTFLNGSKSFGFKYNLEGTDSVYKSNLDNARFMSYLPKWSGAYQNYFSNTAKILSPINEIYSANLGNLGEILANNTKIKDFGYQEKYFYYITGITNNIPLNLKSEDGILTYIGEQSINFVGDFPVTSINIEPANGPVIKEVVTFPSVFISPISLFISSTTNFQSTGTCVIYGIDENGIEVSENINLTSVETYVSINKYKAVTRFISSVPVTFTTYLDLNTQLSYINQFGPQKRVALLDGTYYQPNFEIVGNSLVMKNSNQLGNEEVTEFYINSMPSKMFISNLLDLFYLNGTTLYTSKLYYDYNSRSQYNSTYNNNEFIFVDNPFPKVGDTVLIGINVSSIASTYGSSKIQLKYNNSYIDISGSSTSDQTWIDLSNSSNRIYIPYVVTDPEDVTFVMEIFNSNQDYSAGFVFNKVPEFKAQDDVTDMFFKNNKLYIEKTDNIIYEVHPNRNFFTSSQINNVNVLIFNKNYTGLNINV